MQVLTRPWGAMHFADSGPATGPAVVLANSLGTDLRLWDALLPLLPPGLRLVRFDKRGHGLSDISDDAYAIADLAGDAAALIAHLGLVRPVFVGLSIGGLIGQALALDHPGLLAGVVLSNTGARIGTAESWQARTLAVRAGGMTVIADAVMERWFAPAFRATPDIALWRNMLCATPVTGYALACDAIAAADYGDRIGDLRLPVLGIAGALDLATPPDLLRAMVAAIPGARLAVIPEAGHIPCVEHPAAHAALITDFLREIGHV